jgi:lipopolysaccharide assembly outer membrane protein LptD (OstA)
LKQKVKSSPSQNRLTAGVSTFVGRVLAPSLVISFLLITSLFSWSDASLAQSVARNSRLKADRFVDRVIDGEPVSCMYGNVFIDRDTITVAADTAYAYRNRDIFEFVGNVRVTRANAVVTSERGDYERQFGNGNFYGNVRIVEGDLIGTGRIAESRGDGRILRLIGNALLVTPDYSVRGDTIVQDRLTGRGEAFGNVSIIEPDATNLVTGQHAVFDSDGDVAEVDQEPVLTSREQDGEPLHSVAGLMRFYRNEERVVMIDSVRIRQGLTMAEADTAVAYGKNRMVLTGAPNVTMGGQSTMFGDQIDFRYAGGELRQLIITGTARMEDSSPDSLARLYQGLPDMDIIEGDSITVDFEDGAIRRSVVVGNAHSRYTPLDLNDEVATNDATGDTITIHFKRKRVARVRIEGNAQGEYRFARLAAMNDMLGKSRRLADLLARDNADSTATTESLVAEVDSIAGTLGMILPVLNAQSADSLLGAAMDSLAAAGFDTSRSALDFQGNAQNVKYSGERVTFEMADRSMEIEKQGVLDYGTMHMTAEHIKLDTDSRELYAEGNPVVEDSDTIVGTKMGYNFEHKSASVVDGVTAFDEYYFVGDNIRRFGDQTMKICGGQMSSCDLEVPHYYFWSGKMKLRPKDKVVAAPIVLRVGNVPIFALPFYYKNMKEGRQSGILFPSFDFGWSSREGRYVRDFGYYWATNDFMDFVVEGDYNERSELGYRVSNRYVKRYGFNGGVDYSRKIGLGDNDVDEWQLRWNHNQPILWDDYKFRTDVKMASTTLTSNDFNGSNGRDIVSGQLKSSAYLSRSWSFGNASMNANRDERVNASDEDPTTDNLIYSMTLPSLSMNFKQFTLAPSLRSGDSGSMFGNILRSTYFQQGYSIKSDNQGYEDREEATQTANGNWSLSYRPARLGIFNVSLAANARQTWTRDTVEGQLWNPDTNFVDGGFYTDIDEETEKTQPGMSFSTGVGTTLYGLFPLQVGRLKALRHTARFNTSWNLSPGLGSKQLHNTSVGLSMDNRIDAKYLGAGSDSTITEKKIDGVIDWSLRTSFRPKAAANAQWGDITSGLTIKPGQSRYLKLQVSNSINPYLLALKSTRFTYQVNFSGRLDVGEVPEYQPGLRNEAIDRLGVDFSKDASDSTRVDDFASEFSDQDRFDDRGDGDYFEGEEDSFNDLYNRADRNPRGDGEDVTEGGRYIPFDVGGSFSYSYTNLSKDKRATANLNFNTQLTRNWEFRYTASFDLEEGQATRQQYSLNRDLHCWRFEFNRIISNVDSQFGFRIYLRSIPALKFARGREDYMGAPGGDFSGGIF